MITDLQVEKYTEKSFVVRGKTQNYAKSLRELGGKYNPALKGGIGWIFSNNAREKVDAFIKDGANVADDEIVTLETLNKKLDLLLGHFNIHMSRRGTATPTSSVESKEEEEDSDEEEHVPVTRILGKKYRTKK